MADSLKRTPFTQHQQSDLEAASDAVYSAAADEIVESFDNRTLGLDLLALVTIFLIVVTYHIQNPLLQFESQFGRAFRNASLQNVLTVMLVVVAFVLIRAALRRNETNSRTANGQHPLLRVSALVLAVYCVFVVVAIVFDWNALAALFNIDPVVFLDEIEEGGPVDLVQNALTISTVFEYLAIAATALLWQPWTRLAVYRRAIRKQIAALVVAVLVLVAWELVIVVFQIQQFLLPRPSVIAATFSEVYPRLISAGWLTFQNAFWGFVIGCGAGILTGMVSARFVSFSKALLPVAIGINAIPIIALAPIFNNWFGALNPASKIAIVVVLVYFPSMISTVRGLTSVDPLSLELMRSYAAGNWAIFRKLRLPNALPYMFSALKVATTLSMIGSIVSEYFGGSTAGLGYRIRDDAGLFKYPEAWSAILVASLFGILFYLVVSAVERALLSWHVSFRESSDNT